MGGQCHALVTSLLVKRTATHFTGGWVGPRAGLDGCGKSFPHLNSILRLPSLYLCRLCVFIVMQNSASDWFAFCNFRSIHPAKYYRDFLVSFIITPLHTWERRITFIACTSYHFCLWQY